MIVALQGPLTLQNLFTFQEQVAFLRKQNGMSALVVDLAGTPYVDSAGLGAIINCYVSAQKNDKHFFMVGVNERLRALLEMAHVETLIRSFATVEDAEASLTGN